MRASQHRAAKQSFLVGPTASPLAMVQGVVGKRGLYHPLDCGTSAHKGANATLEGKKSMALEKPPTLPLASKEKLNAKLTMVL